MVKIKHKAAATGFSFYAGLLIAAFAGAYLSLAFGFALIAAGIVCAALKKQAAALILLMAGVGAGLYAFYLINICFPVYALDGQTVSASGVVIDITERENDSSTYIVNTELNGVKCKISLYGASTVAEYGDTLLFDAKLSRFMDNGFFAENSYNFGKGVLLKANAENIVVVPAQRRSAVYYIRKYNDYINSEITSALPGEEGALLKALFLGDKSALSDETAAAVKICGISHYTAVSGLHLTLIAHAFILALSLTRPGKRRGVKFITLALVTVCLMAFFNLSSSVLRSGLMLIIYYGGELFMRKSSGLNSLGFALLIILLFQPYACLDAGLILSVSGTFGVAVAAPALCKNLKTTRFKSFIELTAASVCASLCTLPASALYFKGTSALAPLMSVVLTPLFTIAVTSATLFALTGGVFTAFMFAGGLTARLMLWLTALFGKLKFLYINLDYSFIPLWVILSLAFVLIALLIYKSAYKAVKAAALSITALSVMICAYKVMNADKVYLEIARETVTVRQRQTIFTLTADDIGEFIGEYDISGKFTIIGDGKTVSVNLNGCEISVTPAKENINADIAVIYGWVKNKREYNADYVIYTSRRMEAENENELSSYNEPVKFIIGE